MTEKKFPTETIDLPSHGWYYDQASPLASGQIELKYLTAKEEDILTSTNLIQKGLVIDRLLEALIIDKSVDFNDLLIGDKNAIMVASRVLGYGKDYDARVACATCGVISDTRIDLTAFDDKAIEEPKTKGVNQFEFRLPTSKKTLTFKLLTQGDENEIGEEVAKLRKVDAEVDRTLTTRLKHIIVAVDGDDDPTSVRDFVDNEFLSRDSKAFRRHYQSVSPDIDLSIDNKCPNCGAERRVAVPIGVDFFWPESEI